MKAQEQKEIETLFDKGAHLGHKKSKMHPKTRRFIYRIENGITIIDLTQTVKLLHEALEFVKKQAKEGKTMLIVSTKKTFEKELKELCEKNNVLYVTKKWPPGLLTNFKTIYKNNIKKLREQKKEKEEGEWKKFPKHEQVKLTKKLNKLERVYGGIEKLEKIPDFLFVIDIMKEKNAVHEAEKLKIPIVAIVDTNSNPEKIQHPIPANDDLLDPVLYISKQIITTYSKNRDEGRKSKKT